MVCPYFPFFSQNVQNSAGQLTSETDRDSVRKFYTSAIEAGGKDNGKPDLRTQIHEDCYAAVSYRASFTNMLNSILRRSNSLSMTQRGTMSRQFAIIPRQHSSFDAWETVLRGLV
jgi:hypothetical protein